MPGAPKKVVSFSAEKLDSPLEVSSDGEGQLNTPTPTPSRKRVTFAKMNGQAPQHHTMGDTAALQGQANGYHHDAKVHGPVSTTQDYTQPQMAGMNGKDMNGSALAHAIGDLSVHNNRPAANYIPVNGNVNTPHGAGMDVNGMQRPHGQYMIVPNGTMIGSMPPAPAFAQVPSRNPTDQGSPLQYLPGNLYPGLVASTPFVPGPVPGYSWPYCFNNNDSQNFTNLHRASWASVDENNPGNPGNPVNGTGQSEYYPGVSPHDRSLMAGYMYNGAPGQFPYQMMRTAGGYALQDVDALVKQDPPIPRAVPAMWTNPSDLTLAKCLENREGITNVYIRGFLPETTDDMLYSYAIRFGKIDRCKAIIDLDTGFCKGFGFVQFSGFDACENCIRGFFHLGYQASFAQKSRNSRLKDLEDRTSSNIYCTNIPMEWAEADLRRHFEPYRVVSEKISRDEKTGVSKEVGFARFESREIAENVIAEFHNVDSKDGVRLLLRFADTKAQKQLKHQSNERRAYRAGEYNFSVEMVQGTPSPSVQRLQQAASHFTPNSQGSYPSPLGVGQVWTPATSISPPGPMANKPVNGLRYSSAAGRSVPNGDNTPSGPARAGPNSVRRATFHDTHPATPRAAISATPPKTMTKTPSPRKGTVRAGTTSPVPSRREIHLSTPKSSI